MYFLNKYTTKRWIQDFRTFFVESQIWTDIIWTEYWKFWKRERVNRKFTESAAKETFINNKIQNTDSLLKFSFRVSNLKKISSYILQFYFASTKLVNQNKVQRIYNLYIISFNTIDVWSRFHKKHDALFVKEFVYFKLWINNFLWQITFWIIIFIDVQIVNIPGEKNGRLH